MNHSFVHPPELLAPAGTLRKLQVAFAYGADAVYVGAEGLSMRPDGASFSPDELQQGVSIAHDLGKKVYVAINSLIMQNELAALRCWIKETQSIPIDAVIVSDPAAMMLIQELWPETEIHISTQMSTANALAAKFWKQIGASRIVLARECSLDDARQITRESDIPVEIFIHGAMCVAVSGRCLLSAYMTGNSASKGQCKNSCRWEWELTEAKRPNESFPVVETEKNTFIMSSTDLCLLEHIPEVINSRVASLKIEGRMKSEYYVASVTRAYRAAIDAYMALPSQYQFNPKWLDEVNATRHHPYSTGFAFGYPSDNPASLQSPITDCGTHDYIGIVQSIRVHENQTLYQIDVKHPFKEGETLEWIAPNHWGGKMSIISILNKSKQAVSQANPGSVVEIMCDQAASLTVFSILKRLRTTH